MTLPPEFKTPDEWHKYLNDTVITRKGIILRRKGIVEKQKDKGKLATASIVHELGPELTKYKQRIVALQNARKMLIYFNDTHFKLLQELIVEGIKTNQNCLFENNIGYFDELVCDLSKKDILPPEVRLDIEKKREIAIKEGKAISKGKEVRKMNLANLLSKFDEKKSPKEFEQEIYIKQQLVQVAILDALIGPHGEKYDDFVGQIQELASDPKQLIQLVKSLSPKSPGIDVKQAAQLDNTAGPMLISVQVNNDGVKSSMHPASPDRVIMGGVNGN